MPNTRTPGYIYDLCRRLRNNATEAEILLWDCLRASRVDGFKFRRQHPIGRYIADFYCREARLVIELEGSVHNRKEQKDYDRIRQETLKLRGLRLLRIKNREVERNVQGVLQKILALSSLPPSPRLRLGNRSSER
jgi:very-short-patch-repair endonuclease